MKQVDKSNGNHTCLGPSDLMGIVVKPKETQFGLVLSPIFMLGIWHKVDWLKENFGLDNLWLGGSWKSHTYLALAFINKSSSPWYFMCKCIDLYVDFM